MAENRGHMFFLSTTKENKTTLECNRLAAEMKKNKNKPKTLNVNILVSKKSVKMKHLDF